MIYLFILLFTLSISMVRFWIKDYLSKFILYSFLTYWFASLIVSVINPYNYYPVNTETYLILLLGVFSFVFGMMIPSNRSKKNEKKRIEFYENSDIRINKTVDKIISDKRIIAVYLLMSAYCLPFVGIAISTAAFQGGVAMDDKIEVIFQGSSFNSLMYQYIMFPLVHIDLCLISYSIYRKKGNWLTRLVYFLYFIEFALLAGGRVFFVVTGLYFALVYVCISSRSEIKKINVKKISMVIILAIVAIYGISMMTSYRQEGKLEIKQSTYSDDSFWGSSADMMLSYSILPISMFNQAFEKGLFDKYQYKYGRATFAGTDVLFNGVMKRLGIPYVPTKEIVDDVQDNIMQIGPDRYSNYAYTGMFYHYIDFGIIGIIIFPMFFGYYFRKIILIYNEYSTFSGVALIGVLYFMMLHSCFTCYFIKSWILPYILILTFIIKNSYKKQKKQHTYVYE